MIANIIIICFVVAGIFFSVKTLIKTHRAAKKAGVPASCCGCSAYKSGQCSSHCSSK